MIYMGMYACKHLYISLTCPKYDLIVLNKYTQHCQLCINNTLDGVVAFTIHAASLKYGSYDVGWISHYEKQQTVKE